MISRILILILALALAGLPSSITGQANRPSLTSSLVTGGVLGTAASALGLGAICAMGDLDDDDIPLVLCSAIGAVVGVAPGLAAGYGLSYPDRASWAGRLRTLAYGAIGGSLEGLVISLASEGDRPLGHTLLGGAWGTGVGLITAAVGPALQVGFFPSVRRSSGGGVEIGVRYVPD